MWKPGLEKAVERQMRNWELSRSQRSAEAAEDTPRVFPFIAISRQSGSGGLTLARELGAQTVWQIYDREILDYMAENDAVQKKIYELADEHPEGYFESILKSLGFEGRPPGSDYFRKLVSSINAIAHSNHAVFVGRGASFMLPKEHGLRVRVIAPEKMRFEHYAQYSGCSLAEAPEAVRRLDADRDGFLRGHFRVDPAAPENYDVVINMETITLHTAVTMIVAGLERKANIRVRRPG